MKPLFSPFYLIVLILAGLSMILLLPERIEGVFRPNARK